MADSYGNNTQDLSTIGVKVGIAIETTAGTKPTTGYIAIPKVNEIPEMDFEPDTIDTTSFDNLKYKSYINGLMDTGGVLSLSANYTERGVKIWDDMVKKQNEATNGEQLWLVISIPSIEDKYFIPINAVPTGVPNTPLNDKVSIGYKFTVTGDILKENVSVDTLFA